jgi:hypothetical protein
MLFNFISKPENGRNIFFFNFILSHFIKFISITYYSIILFFIKFYSRWIRALHGSPMGTHLIYCKYLFSNKILSDKMHIGWKLHYFYIYFYKRHCHIVNVSRDIEGFLINPQLKCFEILSNFSWIATMTPKENFNENLRKSISEIFGKKFMGTHCNALRWLPQ